MPLHRNESSNEKTLNYKGAAQTTFVKENHSLSRERITAMTSVASQKQSTAPKLEFVFKGTGKRVKLNPPKGLTLMSDIFAGRKFRGFAVFAEIKFPRKSSFFSQPRKLIPRNSTFFKPRRLIPRKKAF